MENMGDSAPFMAFVGRLPLDLLGLALLNHL
jgi:hypothetical protein